jgi:hypothetical protein
MEGPAEVFFCEDRQEGGQHGAASSRCDDEGSCAPHASTQAASEVAEPAGQRLLEDLLYLW